LRRGEADQPRSRREQDGEPAGIKPIAFIEFEWQLPQRRADAEQRVACRRKHGGGDDRLLAAAAQDVAGQKQRMHAADRDDNFMALAAVRWGYRGARGRAAFDGGIAETSLVRRIRPQEFAESKIRANALSKIKPRRSSDQRDDVVVNKTRHR